MKTPKIDVYQDKYGDWRWRLVAANGRIVADSGEAYARKGGAIKAIQRMRELAVVAEGPDDRGLSHMPIDAKLALADLH